MFSISARSYIILGKHNAADFRSPGLHMSRPALDYLLLDFDVRSLYPVSASICMELCGKVVPVLESVEDGLPCCQHALQLFFLCWMWGYNTLLYGRIEAPPTQLEALLWLLLRHLHSTRISRWLLVVSPHFLRKPFCNWLMSVVGISIDVRPGSPRLFSHVDTLSLL